MNKKTIKGFIEDSLKIEKHIKLLKGLQTELERYLSRYQELEDPLISFFGTYDVSEIGLSEEELSKVSETIEEYTIEEYPFYIKAYKDSAEVKKLLTEVTDILEKLDILEKEQKLEGEFIEDKYNFLSSINYRFFTSVGSRFEKEMKVTCGVGTGELLKDFEVVRVIAINVYGYTTDEVERYTFHKKEVPGLKYVILNCDKISLEENLRKYKRNTVEIVDVINF